MQICDDDEDDDVHVEKDDGDDEDDVEDDDCDASLRPPAGSFAIPVWTLHCLAFSLHTENQHKIQPFCALLYSSFLQFYILHFL